MFLGSLFKIYKLGLSVVNFILLMHLIFTSQFNCEFLINNAGEDGELIGL